jgi:hypothetical protein
MSQAFCDKIKFKFRFFSTCSKIFRHVAIANSTSKNFVRCRKTFAIFTIFCDFGGHVENHLQPAATPRPAITTTIDRTTITMNVGWWKRPTDDATTMMLHITTPPWRSNERMQYRRSVSLTLPIQYSLNKFPKHILTRRNRLFHPTGKLLFKKQLNRPYKHPIINEPNHDHGDFIY